MEHFYGQEEERTTVGQFTYISPRVRLGKGVRIGHNGYAYIENTNHEKTMVKHFGRVSIGDRVLIGENTCISRGTIDDTVLEDGVKIDALGHIAHNCWLEEDVAMAAPCRINGSSHIGRNSYLTGSIVRNQCTIGENAFVGLGAVVVKDVPPGETVAGIPAKLFHRKMRRKDL